MKSPMSMIVAVALLIGSAACSPSTVDGSPDPEESSPLVLRQGSHEFEFRDSLGNVDRPIPVRYHMPQGYTPMTPIVFVMHGASRTGQSYFDVWEGEAAAHGFLLVVPEFDDVNYPGPGWYNLGHVFSTEAPTNPNPENEWTYTAIEHLFDVVRRAAGSQRAAFRIYGHSAGSQFVHRFLMLRPDAPIERAVAANAGWYTLPTDTTVWPYGLGDSGFDLASVAPRFQLPVTVLLGDQDTDETQSNLRQTPEAMRQGPHRFARGHTFFEVAQGTATSLGVPFAWQLDTVPGAHHSNRLMAPRAAEILAR